MAVCVPFCRAQDTVERKNRLSDSVTERFYVLRADQQTRQGSYQAFFRKKIVLASGRYKKNMKTGVWYFYNTTGRIIEKYDYDTREFLFEGPLDTGEDLSFKFDAKFSKNDTVTRPLKIGGSYYGYIPYVTFFKLPLDTMDINTDSFDAYIELLVTPLGRLADYKVRLTSEYYQYNHTFNLDTHLFNEEDRTFQPATLNNNPILSRIIIKCFVDSAGDLDFY
jgi:hypothetical protein